MIPCNCPPGVPPVSVVPEPATVVLMAVGLLALAVVAWRRRRALGPATLLFALLVPLEARADPCKCPTLPPVPPAEGDGGGGLGLLAGGLLGLGGLALVIDNDSTEETVERNVWQYAVGDEARMPANPVEIVDRELRAIDARAREREQRLGTYGRLPPAALASLQREIAAYDTAAAGIVPPKTATLLPALLAAGLLLLSAGATLLWRAKR